MDHAAVLAKFDKQMRRDPAPGPGILVEREERVTRVVSATGGWGGVLWTHLTEADADEAIGAQIRRFDGTLSEPWEWKYYSYDQPADLAARLLAAGFTAGEEESLLVAEVADIDVDPGPPDGVDLVPVTDAAGVAAVVRVHEEVFGEDHSQLGAAIAAGLQSRPHSVEAVLAVAHGTPICAGRVEFPEAGEFASMWGGGTLPGWRGRGVYRSLVAYRAGLARQRGYRYLQIDALAASRPILTRLGFAELATTTPYTYQAQRSG